MIITMNFADGKSIEVNEYCTVNIQRNKKNVDINLTNALNNLSLNNIYDKIAELQDEDKTFSVTVKTETGSAAVYDGVAASYYNSGDSEILCISTVVDR